jgi:hypothetical protein
MNNLDAYLVEVKERCEAATEGPWELGVTYNHISDAPFIAHARTDVPRLLEMVEVTITDPI